MFLNILKNSQENPCVRVSFLMRLQKSEIRNFNKKETLAQVFSREYCAIFKNTFFYRTPPVAPSGKIRRKSLKSAKFQFQLFLTVLDTMGSLYIVTK